mmetsp:Transcript_17561/g.41529  ORF Transcript_17561/g.41529 Transcript_17561/m.41529 type:complete len:224 (-) Transcript_17561:805-1476(-)
MRPSGWRSAQVYSAPAALPSRTATSSRTPPSRRAAKATRPDWRAATTYLPEGWTDTSTMLSSARVMVPQGENSAAAAPSSAGDEYTRRVPSEEPVATRTAPSSTDLTMSASTRSALLPPDPTRVATTLPASVLYTTACRSLPAVTMRLPPLREAMETIPALADDLWRDFLPVSSMDWTVSMVTPAVAAPVAAAAAASLSLFLDFFFRSLLRAFQVAIMESRSD